MNWEKFNNRLRKDAEGQNNDVDIDSIWNAIEPEVDAINTEKKKKRRAIFFWWGTGVLLLSIGLWLFGSQFSQKENIVQKTDNQSITTEVNNTKKENDTNQNALEESENNIDLQKSDLPNQSSSVVKTNDRTSKQSKKSTIKTPKTPKSNNVLNNNRSIENTSAIVSTIPSNEELILRGSHSSKDVVRADIEILSIASLSKLLNFSTEKISLNEEEKVWEPTIKTPPKKKNNSQFSIGIYGGANYTHRTLAEKRDEANQLLQVRETYETPLETSQVGVNFSYKILNEKKFNVEITSGLQLTSIAERYKNYSTVETNSDFWGVEYLSYGLGNEPTEIYGWISQTKTTEYKKEIFNTYRMVDIPILISYNRSFGEKWQAGIQGGIFANLALKTEGIIPDRNLNDIDLGNGDGIEFFKSNVGLSYHLGLNFSRTFSKNWELNISPSVRYFGNDFTADSYSLSQKYILIGGNIGIKYRF